MNDSPQVTAEGSQPDSTSTVDEAAVSVPKARTRRKRSNSKADLSVADHGGASVGAVAEHASETQEPTVSGASEASVTPISPKPRHSRSGHGKAPQGYEFADVVSGRFDSEEGADTESLPVKRVLQPQV